MAMVVYGTKVFSNFAGYYGEKELCHTCNRTYKPMLVKNSVWGHIYYIPLLPIKTYYTKICPICGYGDMMKKKEAIEFMNQSTNNEKQELQFYAKHVLANKPTKMLQADNSYEFWVKDLVTGEDIFVINNLTKGQVNNMKKNRGLKDISFIDV